jgi:hypothetical protein
MRLRILLPFAAVLALGACGDDAANQTGSTNNDPPASAAPPANPTSPPTTPTTPGGTTPSR